MLKRGKSSRASDCSGDAMAKTSATRTLLRDVSRLRRVVLRGEMALTLAPVVLWVAAVAVAAVVMLRAYRRREHSGAGVGAGDDKPAGYENPAPHDRTDLEAQTPG
jgi:hypothetical protein